MNPLVDKALIAQAYEDDPARAAAEYGAEFRTDIEGFISREAVDACVVQGRYELPRQPNTPFYAFTDPSGGADDSFTLAIAHRVDGRVVIDALRERRPPFSPDDVCREYAQVLQSYGLSSVVGDRYAGEWPRERFAAHGINYQVSDKTKSELYLELLPVTNAGQIELLDHSKLVSQLCNLERRTSRAGKDSIDHAPEVPGMISPTCSQGWPIWHGKGRQ